MEVTLALLCDTPTILLHSSSSPLALPLPQLVSEPDELNTYRRKGNKKVRLQNFTTVVVGYIDEEFRQHFRLRRNAFELLLQHVGPRVQNSSVGRRAVNPSDQLLVTLWTLATPESFRAIAERFGIERGNANRIVYRVIAAINTLSTSYIRWPGSDDMQINAMEFTKLRRTNFPGVVGCVDGCHIPIKQPSQDKSSYYNRNKYHSIVLQGVCDHRMIFTDVFVGWPGAAHDARIWQNSPLYRLLEAGNLDDDFHLLGDSAYPISPFVMVPFKDNGHLTQEQKTFNQVLSSTRVVIEQAFGLLKTRFRRLKFLDVNEVTHATIIVLASCILHNMCILYGDTLDEEIEPIDDVQNDQDDNNNIGRNELSGQEKRAEICNELSE